MNHLYRGNRTIKNDCSKFNGFGSTISSLVSLDIDFKVRTNLINQIKHTEKEPTFRNKLSDEFICLPMHPETSELYLESAFEDDYFKAYILDCSHGFFDKMVNGERLSSRLIKELKDGKLVIIKTKHLEYNHDSLDDIERNGGLVLSEITMTALCAKVSYILANVK